MSTNGTELPEGHEPLLPETMGFLSIKDKEIYWHGQKLKTEQQLHLTFFQKAIATLVTAAAISGPVIAFLASKNTILGNEKTDTPEQVVTMKGPVEVKIGNLPILATPASHVIISAGEQSSTVELVCREGSIEINLDELKKKNSIVSCP